MNWYLAVLKKYAVFHGRARRKEYWMFFLINIIIAFGLGLIEGLAGINPNTGRSVLADFYQLAILLPSIAVGIRRMHDVNRSGWLMLVPIYNLFLAVKPGDVGENRFGPDPLDQFDNKQ
jgi:uncharacterized membrane protein YhaH (DUF805 family)